MRTLCLVALVACAPRALLTADAPVERPADQIRHYTIWLGGARVGTAVETETWTAAGVHLRRDETMRFLRGDAPVALTTTIDIVADPALVASRVSWTERGPRIRHGEAARDATGWRVDTDDGVLRLAGAAVPSELVPLILRRDGRFTGAVFLPARGFAAGTGRIEPVAPHRLVARLALTAGIAEATIDLDPDGTPARVVDGEGVIAIRVSAARAMEPFQSVDLVAATSVPISGTRGAHLALEGDLALPPLPGQSAQTSATGLLLELSPRLPGGLPPGTRGADRSREITALVAEIQRRIAPDLGTGPVSARDASAATAGDCTTYALAYAALAAQHAIPTRVVTGLRVDGARLVRHRWAVSWTGRTWIAVDAAFGAAPAGGDLVGLAIHDADDAGLVAGEGALTQLRAAAWTD